MSTRTPLLIKLTILTLFLLLHSATSSYPSHSSPSPSPSSPLDESPLTHPPSPSPSPTQPYSPPAPQSQSLSPTQPPTSESPSAPSPTPSDNITPTPPPVEEETVTDDTSMNIMTEETKKRSSGGNGVGVAFGLIGAACVVIFGGAVYKKRRDNIRRSRRYSSANIQLI